MVRDRSFGGKAGTWLRKKRRKLSIGAGSKANEAQSAASTTPTIHTTTTTSSTGAGSKAASAVSTTSTTINTTSVIGWDEVRARPIYGKPTRPTSSSNSRSSSENDSSSDIDTTASPVVRRALRSYGGKRRNRISTDPDEFDTVETIHSSSNSNCDASSPGSLPETMLNSLMASPRRVSMAGNAQRLTSSSSSSSSGKSNHSSVLEFQEKDLPKQRNIKNKFVLMEDDCCKTPKGRVSVVSSTTSLSAAKHFFQALDREHNLVVTTESNSASPNHRGRQVTRRRIARSSSRNDLPLTQGYTSYFTACQASNCSPLPLVRVATEIYDGFLDD